MKFSHEFNQKWLTNTFLFLLLLIITIAVTSTYISNEHTFYFWDFSNYSDITNALAVELRGSPIKSLYGIWMSTGYDYSTLPALPIVPFISIFGDSRLVFILSLVLVYLLPYTLVMGAIATELIPFYPRVIYWLTVLLTLLTPMVWVPTLRGYSDIGAALIIAIATLIYVKNVTLKHGWQIVLIGFLLGLAPLFRRHFVYSDISFFSAMMLQILLDSSAKLHQGLYVTLRELAVRGQRIGLVGITALITILLLGYPFIDTVLHTDFGKIYASYEVPLNQSLQYYFLSYGWIACFLAALGLLAGLRIHALSHSVAAFLLLFGSVSFILWVVKVQQLGVHYTTHFTSFVVLGLAAFSWMIWFTSRLRTRLLALVVGSTYIALNAILGLVSVDFLNNTPLHPTQRMDMDITFSSGSKLGELFSSNNPPLSRSDYSEIERLVNYLTTIKSPAQPVYVAASSVYLNRSILKSADLKLHQQNVLNILRSPDIDSRDFYPLEALLQAQYVVIATPPQYHLQAAEQDVIKVVVDAFNDNWEISQDFVKLPKQFYLSNGDLVDVYERIQSTSLKTTLHTLKAMQDYIGMRPGEQRDWINLSKLSENYISLEKNDSNRQGDNIRVNLDSKNNLVTSSLLYLNSFPKRIQIAGKINLENEAIVKHQGIHFLKQLLNFKIDDSKCETLPDTLLEFSSINEQGKVLETVKFRHKTVDDSDFDLLTQTEEVNYLLFNLASNISSLRRDSVSQCSLLISDLTMLAK